MSPIELAIRHNVERHRFEADLEGGALAIAEYNVRRGKVAFTHTEVPAEYGGRGIGTALVRFALGWARDSGLKVIPLCPFFAAYIGNHPDEQDLLEPSYRERMRLA